MFIFPDPDEFFDAVFFIDPVTKTVDDSLVMALSKDTSNADRYSKFLKVRSSLSSPRVDDETNFELCMPRSVQSLSQHQFFNDTLKSFIDSLSSSILGSPDAKKSISESSPSPDSSDPSVQIP